MTAEPGDPGRGEELSASGSADVPAEDLAALLRAPGMLTAAQVAELTRLDDDLLGLDGDPLGLGGDPLGPGDGPDAALPQKGLPGRPGDCLDAWLAAESATWLEEPGPERPPGERHEQAGPALGTAAAAAAPAARAQPAVAEAFDAGFTHRGGGQGRGFAAGGDLDRMEPGGRLATAADWVWAEGLGKLSDDELCGFLAAQRRLASRAAAGELAAVHELSARRAGPDGRPGEHAQDELAALLALTGTAAAVLAGHAAAMARLPGVAQALAAGRIDMPKAAVFAAETACLDDIPAAAIAASVLPEAPGMTTGQLRAALRREVLAYDPQAAIKRRREAEKDARVETWAEGAGTAAIAGRDLAPADVIRALKNLDADARWLEQHGVPGTHDQLRARAMIARLSGQPLPSLLPAGGGGPLLFSAPAQPAGLTGSVNLTMPASTWLSLSDMPGEVGGNGAADADTCRDLAAALAAHRGARWCLTLTGPDGRAVAHGCARAGPGPPGTGDPAAWLAGITVVPIEAGTCSHRRESAAYRPPGALRHLIKIRSRRCGFPGCRRPASRCDDDHTIPHHKGGKTCECNLHPLCRRHHRAKQAPGWRVSQPEPGVLTWRLPSGRRFTAVPDPYPA